VLAIVVVLVVAGAGVALAYRAAISGGSPAGPPCRAAIGTQSYSLDLEQAANASTVAAVAKTLGLADHAVTVALAAALQESNLHNVAYGDLDSVGLFQQRPSQGWGTPDQILVPAYAAAAFYQRLKAVPAWQTLAVTEAAQAVQRSAGPDAYAQWEPAARLLAQVLTGEEPAGLSCRFPAPAGAAVPSDLAHAMTEDLGSSATGDPVPTQQGWTVAAWLVGHASRYGITSVSFEGRRWTRTAGAWGSDPVNGPGVRVALS